MTVFLGLNTTALSSHPVCWLLIGQKMTKNFDNEDYYGDETSNYLLPEKIENMALFEALTSLYILGDDMFMRMQAHNLEMVDEFIMNIEYQTLRELVSKERTPTSAHFLSAQSQMWIFAAYELMRTWQERCKNIIKWENNGGLQQKLNALKDKADGVPHFGLDNQIQQLEAVIADPSLIARIKNELLHLYIPFTRLEFIRVAIAKHEVSGKAKVAALMPGYGRINMYCGSLDYQMDSGKIILGTINRRDIADSFRNIDCTGEPPSAEVLKSFDDFMSCKNFRDLE